MGSCGISNEIHTSLISIEAADTVEIDVARALTFTGNAVKCKQSLGNRGLRGGWFGRTNVHEHTQTSVKPKQRGKKYKTDMFLLPFFR